MVWTIVCFIIAAVVVALDQITKVVAVDKLLAVKGHSVEIIDGILAFSYVENDGMALGLLGGNSRWIYMTVSTIAIIALSVYIIKWRPNSKLATIAIGFIIGGGIGNMIDRCFYTGVVGSTSGMKVVRDFIDVNMFGELWPWVFNVADAFVCIGGVMLFAWCLYSLVKESIEEKKAKAAVSSAENTDNENIEENNNKTEE